MKRILVLLLAALLLAGCASKPANDEIVAVGEGSYRDVTPAELKAMLASKDFTFVNVHIPFEGNIAGTDLSIPYNAVQENLSLLPADKGAKIVLYCRSGRMSQMAAEELVSLGYTNIWNLKGGMVDWENAGYAIEMQP
jgi:rhodanese-related sulfurtransferase